MVWEALGCRRSSRPLVLCLPATQMCSLLNDFLFSIQILFLEAVIWSLTWRLIPTFTWSIISLKPLSNSPQQT